jgi:hypothetical protein
MKQIERKITAFVMTILLFVSIYNFNTYAGVPSKSGITEKFVAESEYSVERDSKGESVIILTNVQPSSSFLRSGSNDFIKTSLAILPSNEQEANDIIANIESLSASGSLTEDDWFYGSSVYLTSTISYSTTTVSGLDYGKITKVTISATTNSGSSISSMSLLMGQNGWATGGYKQQRQTFNATTTRSFTPPSSWAAVLWDGSGDVGASLTCTAVRQGGQSTFTLYNSIQ